MSNQANLYIISKIKKSQTNFMLRLKPNYVIYIFKFSLEVLAKFLLRWTTKRIELQLKVQRSHWCNSKSISQPRPSPPTFMLSTQWNYIVLIVKERVKIKDGNVLFIVMLWIVIKIIGLQKQQGLIHCIFKNQPL